MIDQHFIESAKQIRRKFLSSNSDLTKYRDEIKKLLIFLDEKVNNLKRIEDDEFKNKATKEEIQRVVSLIMVEINSIELEQKNLAKRINYINEDILKIQKEEEMLYKKIKERYPNVSDEDLREEIQSNLEE